MIGRTISHYQISEKLGGGGMGVVYKARDLKLKRTVALKFLPPELTRDEEAKQRFIHEAQAASALDHVNVGYIHEIDEAEDGRLFIAMAYYAGETLKKKIARGPLPVAEALDYAVQIAQGLSTAHEAGIIHRDVKPANVMVTKEGVVKIVDFGLAKVAEQTQLTKTGSRLGTVAYMSPEQARGEEVDAQTDIWSLGVVLYEMLSGERPFRGDYEQAVIYSILNVDPKPVRTLRPEVPEVLGRVLARTLAKDAAARYTDANALLSDPRTLESQRALSVPAPEQKPVPSIAVLPFADMSPQRDQEYFCDGMAEEIINALTQVCDLHVVARTSAFSFKGQQIDVREIGRKLCVKAVLEGSVRKAGNRLRITAQLVNVADGYHVWSEKYDRQLDDVFAIQDEISLAIVEKLKLKLTSGEEARFVHKQTVNRAAHEAYLKGRYFWNQRGPGLKKSIQFFELALAEDNNYAAAHAGLADAYALLGFYGYLSPREVMPKAKKAAQRALKIDENLAEAHCSLGYIHTTFDWEWEKARREFQRALELNPNYGPARYWYSNLLMVEGRLEEAIAEVRRGAENDPLSVYMLAHLGLVLITAHKYTEASEQLRKALELERDFFTARSILGLAYYFQSRVEESIREIQKAIDSSDRHQFPMWTIGTVYAASGDRARAEEIVMELERRTQNEYIVETHIASIYALLGEKDQAFYWLEKAYEERAPVLCAVENGQPSWAFDSLRTDLRFRDLMRRIGLRDAD